MNLSWIGDFLKNTKQVAQVAGALNTGLSALGIKTNLGASATGLGLGADLTKAFASPDLGTQTQTQTSDTQTSQFGTDLSWLEQVPEWSTAYAIDGDLADNWGNIGSQFIESPEIGNLYVGFTSIPGADYNIDPWQDPNDASMHSKNFQIPYQY